MEKNFEVTCIPSPYLPQISGQSNSFSVPLPEEFDSREEAEKYVSEVEQREPKVQCAIREVAT